jgi:ketosteroid isomerase-like protein
MNALPACRICRSCHRMLFRPERVDRSGDLAYDSGTYTETLGMRDGGEAGTAGSYLTIYRRGSKGKWQIVAQERTGRQPGR